MSTCTVRRWLLVAGLGYGTSCTGSVGTQPTPFGRDKVKVKTCAETAVAIGVVRLTCPLAAPAATVAVAC